jgi:hypothetical protein
LLKHDRTQSTPKVEELEHSPAVENHLHADLELSLSALLLVVLAQRKAVLRLSAHEQASMHNIKLAQNALV